MLSSENNSVVTVNQFTKNTLCFSFEILLASRVIDDGPLLFTGRIQFKVLTILPLKFKGF